MRIVPVNNKILVRIDKIADVEDVGGFKVMRTKKDSLIRGEVIRADERIDRPEFPCIQSGAFIYFSSYGHEAIGDEILVDFVDIWAYEREIDRED